jgi:hypothetical protein
MKTTLLALFILALNPTSGTHDAHADETRVTEGTFRIDTSHLTCFPEKRIVVHLYDSDLQAGGTFASQRVFDRMSECWREVEAVQARDAEIELKLPVTFTTVSRRECHETNGPHHESCKTVQDTETSLPQQIGIAGASYIPL